VQRKKSPLAAKQISMGTAEPAAQIAPAKRQRAELESRTEVSWPGGGQESSDDDFE